MELISNSSDLLSNLEFQNLLFKWYFDQLNMS